MSRKNKIFIFGSIFVISVITFILEIFVFQKPDGNLGLFICITSILFALFSGIMLCVLSKKMRDFFMIILDLLLVLP